ncbi:MAG: hypothetical protein HETSPECPRED_010182 [Heterodermia speciosa]|uniref:Uncharacterized protein n=1 Tax=Heterodermia speciosa TaxID=116794 RepID=A0A8H3EQA6_9LECA|nr:MAG: hypothetical protein HETSPECPRED_010182 [Heterodermia speciosa]
MAKTGNLDQSPSQKLPSSSSSVIASATSMRDRVTSPDSGGQHTNSYKALEKYPQKAFQAHHSHDQARGSYQAPMLRRWLDGDKSKEAGQLGDRDGYPKGGAGMSQYLNDWDRAWQRAGNQANGKDLGQHLSKD